MLIERPHRVRVVAEAVDEAGDVLVDQRVATELALPVVELGAVRQLAFEDQIGDLEIAAVRGQILDRVAAMAERPGAAVEVGDRAPAGRRVAERRIERDQLRVVGPCDLTEIGRR